jgi:hypothetical protein
MQATELNASLQVALLQELQREANSLPPSAASTAEMLRGYIDAVEDPSQTDAALVRLKEFSWHYKGMRDVIVIGVPDSEWFEFVAKVRKLSATACRARGLDQSLVGRISTAFRRLFRAH